MTNYEIVLFLHIVGMVGMFGGIAVSIGVLQFARRARDVASVRALLPLGAIGGRLIPLFSLLVLGTGVYMVEDVWKWDISWIEISLAAFIVLFAMGPLINARRMKAIGMEAGRTPDGPVSQALRARLDDLVLHVSEITMTAATLGIVYLMVTKPGTSGSLIAMVVAVALGLLVSSVEWIGAREEAAQEPGPVENPPTATP